jgi:PAS domain S-box-containing protein
VTQNEHMYMNINRSDRQDQSARVLSDSDRVRRCAVCKIDLKGRFVYIDDETEALFGLTKEELFGQPFEQFLAEQDRELIGELLCERSKYETFYDAARISLLHHGGEAFSANVIVSLNFIAGNPVNFQFIINPDKSVEKSAPRASGDATDRRFVETVARIVRALDWDRMRSTIEEYCMARLAAIYRIEANQLLLQAGPPADRLESLPSPGQLHEYVAESGEDYVFSSGECVQKAIELAGKAPHEIVFRLDLDTFGPVLVRLAYPEDIADDAAGLAVSRAQFAAYSIHMTSRSGITGREHSESGTDNLPVIDALSKLGIGLCQIDASSRVVAYNNAMGQHLSGQMPANMDEFIALLAETNPVTITDLTATYFEAATAVPGQSWSLRIRVPAGNTGQLAIVGLQAESLSGRVNLLFTPDELPNQDQIRHVPDTTRLLQVLSELTGSAEAAVEVIEKLTHEHHGELGKNGGFYLHSLKDRLNRQTGMLKNFSHCVDLLGATETAGSIDLEVLLEEVAAELTSAYPALSIEYASVAGVKVRGYLQRTRAALRMLTEGCLQRCGENPAMSVSVDIEGTFCRLRLDVKPLKIPVKHAERLWRFSLGPGVSAGTAVNTTSNSFAVARELTASMGGDIDCQIENEGTARFIMSFPVHVPVEGE